MSDLGCLHGDSKAFDDAIRCHNKAIELKPTEASFYHSRGVTKQKLGLFKEAAVDFKEALRLSPKHPSYITDYQTNEAVQGGKGAIPVLESLHASNPNNLIILINLSTAYITNGQYSKAIGFLNSALHTHPTDISCLMNLVAAYQGSKDYFAALDVLDKLMPLIEASSLPQKRQFLIGSYYQLATIMTACGYWDEAANAYTLALTLSDEKDTKDIFYFHRANVLFDNKKYAEAIADYKNISPANRNKKVMGFLQEAEEALVMKEEKEFAPHSETNVFERFENEEMQEALDKHIAVKEADVAAYKDNLSYTGGVGFFSSVSTDFNRDKQARCYELTLNTKDDLWYRKYCAYIHIRTGLMVPVEGSKIRVASSPNVYAFIVTKDNKILINNRGHYDLARRKDVKFAGCISFKDGKIGMWNNCSGHYKPHHYIADDVARATGLPLDKFQARHIIKKRVDALIEQFGNDYREVARALSSMTFGDHRTAKELHASL